MANFVVSIAADENDGNTSAGDLSLREAIALANANADADTITFAAGLSGQRITLTLGELQLTNDVTIDGDVNGDDKADIAIDGNNATRILHITGAATDASLKSLRLENGHSGSYGGPEADRGGGIRADGIASLAITDTSVAGCYSALQGGGIKLVSVGQATIANSLIANNTAGYGVDPQISYFASYGGGLHAVSSNVTIVNTTVTGNRSYDLGAGIKVDGSGTFNLVNSTVTGNRIAAGGLGSTGTGAGIGVTGAATVNVANSVVVENVGGYGNNVGPRDVFGTIAAATNSVFGQLVYGATIAVNTNSLTDVADAGLGQLLDNGGTVLTRSPLDGSILLGFGSSAILPRDTLDLDHDGITSEFLPLDGRRGLRLIGPLDAGAVEQKLDETITGFDGGDIIDGGNGTDTLNGLGGGDFLKGGPGMDTLNGGDGDDRLQGGAGNDTLNGGAGVNAIDWSDATQAIVFTLADSGAGSFTHAQLGTDTFSNINGLIGGSAGDTLTGNASRNDINTGGGNDQGFGGGGDDLLHGQDGDDTLQGDAGNDLLEGQAGSDVLIGGAGDDSLKGGDGIDFASYRDAAGNVTVSLGVGNNGPQAVGGGLGTDRLFEIENLVGGAFNDTLTGDANANRLAGRDGNDTLSAGSGDDVLAGGTGNDTLIGGAGGDTADFRQATGALTVSLLIAGAQNTGGAGTDTLIGIEHLIGASFADTLTGDGNANQLEGGAGNDTLDGGAGSDTASYANAAGSVTVSLAIAGAQNTGSAGSDTLISFEGLAGSAFADTLTGKNGNDTLSGLGGSDTLMGGDGNDEISGGADLDYLFGNAGADDFNYVAVSDSGPDGASRDRIYDFQAGSDDLDVSLIDARAGSAGNNGFTQFLGAAAFTAEGQVRWYQSGANTVIEFNTTGTSGAEMQIQLNNFTAANLTAVDFIA